MIIFIFNSLSYCNSISNYNSYYNFDNSEMDVFQGEEEPEAEKTAQLAAKINQA